MGVQYPSARNYLGSPGWSMGFREVKRPPLRPLLPPRIAPLMLLCAILSSCASVTFPVEYTHLSHASQHFGPAPTDYGSDIIAAGVSLRWSGGFSMKAVEGFTLERGWCDGVDNGYGALLGPREVFEGTIEYDFAPWGRAEEN